MPKQTISFDDSDDKDENYDPFLEQREPVKSKVKFEEEEADLSDLDDAEEPSEFEEDEQEAQIQSKRRKLKATMKITRDYSDVPKKKSSSKQQSSSEKEIEIDNVTPKKQVNSHSLVSSENYFSAESDKDKDLRLKELELKMLEKQIELKKLERVPKVPLAVYEPPEEKSDIPLIREPINPDGSRYEKEIETHEIGNEPLKQVVPSPILQKRSLFRKMFFMKAKPYPVEKPVVKQEMIINPNEHQLKESDDFISLKRCPQCNTKLHKGKVVQSGDNISQTFKCKNKSCDYFKKINLKK